MEKGLVGFFLSKIHLRQLRADAASPQLEGECFQREDAFGENNDSRWRDGDPERDMRSLPSSLITTTLLDLECSRSTRKK